MKLPYQQRGFSIANLFIIITLLLFFGMTFFKVFPFYLDDMTIASSLESAVDEANRAEMTPLEIRDTLLKRFSINNIDKIQASDINITREAYSYIIAIDYEERVHLIHNIDLVLTFENHAEVKAF